MQLKAKFLRCALEGVGYGGVGAGILPEDINNENGFPFQGMAEYYWVGK